MNTLVRLTTSKRNILVNADEELIKFLQTCKPADTRVLNTYFSLNLVEGEVYANYQCVNKET